jgi:hypothetical protein
VFDHVQARRCLRKKHILDRCVDKRTSALDNIHLLLTHVQEAKSDAKVRKNIQSLHQVPMRLQGYTGVWLQVLEAYKLGVAALKSTLKMSGLTEESAADTMVQVEEVSWYTEQTMCLLDYLRYMQ